MSDSSSQDARQRSQSKFELLKWMSGEPVVKRCCHREVVSSRSMNCNGVKLFCRKH